MTRRLRGGENIGRCMSSRIPVSMDGCPLHLPGRLNNGFNTISPLIVDTTTTDNLRELVKQGPWHARQITEIAVLSLRRRGGGRMVGGGGYYSV